MSFSLSAPRGFTARRGAALVAALAILVILTILVFGLAAMVDFTVANDARGAHRQDASSLARTGLQGAVSLLESNSQKILTDELILEFETGVCVVSVRPASADSHWYQNDYLQNRPGDVLLTVRATPVPKGRNAHSLQQIYLVNAQAPYKRVVLLKDQTL
jgi:hypothetical protein